VARNSGRRLPHLSHSRPNRPDPRNAPMNISCRIVAGAEEAAVKTAASRRASQVVCECHVLLAALLLRRPCVMPPRPRTCRCWLQKDSQSL
jgi:hypothetical protein